MWQLSLSQFEYWFEVPEGYSSGQRGQTVNLLAKPSEVRILPPPPLRATEVNATLRGEAEFGEAEDSSRKTGVAPLLYWPE